MKINNRFKYGITYKKINHNNLTLIYKKINYKLNNFNLNNCTRALYMLMYNSMNKNKIIKCCINTRKFKTVS